MQSKAETVSEYLKEVPSDRREILSQLRKSCKQLLKGYEEVMEYGMPVYKRDGIAEVAFASQQNYISLYIMKQDVVSKNKKHLKGLKVGKGCIKYAKPDAINFEIVDKLLADTAESDGEVC